MPVSKPSSQPVLLLAEDDHHSAVLFEHVFRRVCPHWRFVCQPDGQQAARYMEEQEKPQILVTDLNMPAMNGYELLAWVRERRENFRLFVVVTTGVFDPEIEKRCRELGADELLPKGTPNDSIQALLRRLTERAEREFGVG